MNKQKQVIMSNPNVNVSCEKRRSQAGRADDNLLSLEKINFKTGDKVVSTQVKAYLQTERFRLKFYRKTSHCVGFGCVSFLGRISKGTPGRGPRLLMLFAIILSWCSIIWNSIRSQGFHLKFFRKKWYVFPRFRKTPHVTLFRKNFPLRLKISLDLYDVRKMWC